VARLPGVTLVAGLLGVLAAASYYSQGLTLSHYDAKAHLVVARRIFDSIHPGWLQIGAVWLPLPHLLNALPVQVDWLYRTGLSGVALSVTGFVVGVASLWWLVVRATGSRSAAWAAAAVFAGHPDVLYLQATPMTESLLMGLCLLGAALTWRWLERGGAGSAWPPGLALALACLTRYEAWFVAAATVAAAGVALWRTGSGGGRAAWRAARLAAYPAVAVLAFLVLSRLTVGAWLVTGGFYEVDLHAFHRPLMALAYVGHGLRVLDGWVTIALGLVALVIVLRRVARQPLSSPLLVALALAASALLPLYAFYDGHPFRVRYMVPPTMALAAVLGLGVGFSARRRLAAALVVLVALIETPPFSNHSPMVLEAEWDRPASIGRERVAQYLRQHYDQQPILASMGSLAHFMQETSRVGLSIRDYIHEGIGDLWADSLVAARRHAGWVLIEERAEGGDELSHLRDRSPAFLQGFARVSEGGGVALYRRLEPGGPAGADTGAGGETP
jgi:hypothetical protein